MGIPECCGCVLAATPQPSIVSCHGGGSDAAANGRRTRFPEQNCPRRRTRKCPASRFCFWAWRPIAPAAQRPQTRGAAPVETRGVTALAHGGVVADGGRSGGRAGRPTRAPVGCDKLASRVPSTVTRPRRERCHTRTRMAVSTTGGGRTGAWCDGARPRGVVGDGGRTAGELVTPYESPKIPEKT